MDFKKILNHALFIISDMTIASAAIGIIWLLGWMLIKAAERSCV